MEIVGIDVRAVDEAQYVVYISLAAQRHDCHGVVEMVEDDDIAEEDIHHVRCIVLLHCGVFHVDILEISYGVERGVAVKSANRFLFSFD